MPRVPSSADGFCGKSQQRDAAVKQLALVPMWKPLLVVLAQLWVLRAISVDTHGATDPFSSASWTFPAAASIAYLVFIFVGMRLMKDRKPMELTEYMVMYNLYQTILNTYSVYCFCAEVYNLGLGFVGNAFDRSPGGWHLGFLIYIHYNNKFIELLDTVFMVLRKKNNQVSFLHVYHHVMLIWAWFAVVKFNCGGDAYFGALINSAIHVAMYGYYLMALLGWSCPWKKYLTQCQMLQFAICLAQAVATIFVGSTPLWLTLLQVWVMVNMLVLFGNFYLKSYTKKEGAQKSE